VGKWQEYERRKKEIQKRDLTPAEYEAAIRALAKRLKV
jgi:hypothetical protein